MKHGRAVSSSASVTWSTRPVYTQQMRCQSTHGRVHSAWVWVVSRVDSLTLVARRYRLDLSPGGGHVDRPCIRGRQYVQQRRQGSGQPDRRFVREGHFMGPRHRAREFCDRFGLRVPIVQAPMAGVSRPELAIAVAEAGGMGASGVLRDSPQRIAEWARQFRASSSGVFQLNIWIPESSKLDAHQRRARVDAARQFLRRFGSPPEADESGHPGLVFAEQCRAMLEAQPAVMSSIMGLFPGDVLTGMRERGIAWWCCATSLAEALAAQEAGADAIVAQGMEAGGHRGTFDQDEAEHTDVGLVSLLPWFADHLRIPIIAAGGIADGRGVAAALSLGASAGQVGTALLRSPEADISPQWSAALEGLAPEDTVTTRAYTGRLARAAPSPYLAAWTTPEAPRPAPYPDQLSLVTRWRDGTPEGLEKANHWAGQSAALATTDPAGDIVTRMWRDAEALLA
jgi:nitronate monooxygenase